MSSQKLTNYKKNVFSQYGEDGILSEILKRLDIKNSTCLEFGAWDGVLLSNTAALWTKGWKGILIEADHSKFETLKKVCAGFDCICINKFVTSTGKNSLENILEENNIVLKEIKVLSVDIDGNEYHIFSNLKKMRPPVVIMEYNPTISSDMIVISKEDSFFGSSAKALKELADEKGYKLIAITETNCFFVDNQFAHFFNDIDTTYENIFNPNNLTYLITGYDGKYAFSRQPSYGISLPFNPNNISIGDLIYLSHSHLKTRVNYSKDWIKRIGKKIVGVNNIQKFKYYKSYISWLIKGRPIPAHMVYKRKVLRDCAKKIKINTYIETGTAGGGSIIKMAPYFKKLYTIELDPTLYHQGKALGYDYKNIEFLEGDSGLVIKDVLQKLTSPALFWLDAHYSGGNTAKGPLETPIIQELQTILSHKIKNHVIAIDDMRDFNGTHDYPTLENLEKFLKTHSSTYRFRYDNDLMIIEPINN